VKRAALLLAVLAGACAATPTPTRSELAQALRAFDGPAVAPEDLTHIACQGFEEEPTEFACRWRQREGRRWRDWESYLALSGDGWIMIDTPARRP
jgi:hypothetical protein